MRPLLLLLLLASCKPETKATRSAWPNLDWQEYAFQKLANMPQAKDEKLFCPQGLTQHNWLHLMAAIVRYESNFNPSLEYKERFKNGKGEFVISTGLFQVSYESSRGYGFPGITTQDLKDPKKNIDVAVAIMRKLVGLDGVVAHDMNTNPHVTTKKGWKGGARYWSTLRPSGKLQAVKDHMKGYCQ